MKKKNTSSFFEHGKQNLLDMLRNLIEEALTTLEQQGLAYESEHAKHILGGISKFSNKIWNGFWLEFQLPLDKPLADISFIEGSPRLISMFNSTCHNYLKSLDDDEVEMELFAETGSGYIFKGGDTYWKVVTIDDTLEVFCDYTEDINVVNTWK